MKDTEYDAIVASMPDGMNGFWKTWGLRQFADKVEDTQRQRIRQLEAELEAVGAGGVQPLRQRGQCLAQIQEPAQPVAEICSASGDGAEFGERNIKLLCDISGFEYGTPLYAGAAPAAVAPQGEYPPLPPHQHTDGGPGFTRYWSADAMHAYFDLGRQHAVSTPTDGVCAFCEGSGTVICTDGFSHPCPQRCAAPALEAPAAPMSTAEASAALAINSALHRIRAGNAAGAIEPLEQARAALAAAPQAPAAPALSGAVIRAVDKWFSQNTGLGGCSDKDAAELAAIFAPAAPAVDAQDMARMAYLRGHAETSFSLDFEKIEISFRAPDDLECFESLDQAIDAALAAQAKEGGESC